MFKEKIDSIKAKIKLKLVLVPIFIMVVMTVLVPMCAALISKFIFPVDYAMLGMKSTFDMILSVVFTIILAMLVSKIKLKNLGLNQKGVFSKFL